MSFEPLDVDWSLDYCLACEKQTNGGVYCSERCRLAEYEQANSGSEVSSPSTPRGAGPWPTTKLDDRFPSRPVSDFSTLRTYGSTPPPKLSKALLPRAHSSPAHSKSNLTPSSSQTSLVSMHSASSSSSINEQYQLSPDARKELQAYANFFDKSRYQRRQSTI